MEAFCRGYLEGLRGLSAQWCPYGKMTSEWQAWNRGHRIGCELSVAFGVA